MPLLVLTGVTRRYDRRRRPAVDGLSMTATRAEIVALLGPSGSGKTTILRLIAGFETPDAGRIVLGGQVVADGAAGRTATVPPERRQVGVVFQDYALFPHLTLAGNVGFGLTALPRAARQARVGEMLALVGLAALARRYPHELSGGEQQRVALARALAPGPALLLLDEPFSNLDADLRAQMREELERILRATGTTAIFVTHDQEEAFAIADRVGVLDQGRLEQLADAETLYHRPATPFVAGFLGEADFLPGVVTADGIVTELGVLPNVEGRPAGQKVRVMVRPDDIDFDVSPDGEAVVLRRAFRGAATLYRLGLPSGACVHSVQPSTSTQALGIRVSPRATMLHVVAFPV